MPALPKIETRNQLLGVLAEAAELEHNLMCLYLYAVFSLKSEPDEGLSESELSLVKNWRETLMSICVQEMSHLAIVSNLATAIGGNAHFFRGNFPIKSGYFPADFVMELAPFNKDTLDHFIFLERSSDSELEDSDQNEHMDYTREAPDSSLMTHGGDYSTVSDLYASITQGISYLNKKMGAEKLFCGNKNLQLNGKDVSLEGMDTIHDEASSLKAIERIVEEGEGGSSLNEISHFQKFRKIKKEYEAALKLNPKFSPAHACARNPVMRKPVDSESVVWINAPKAAAVLDIANALYDLMLRTLTLLYSGEDRRKDDRNTILSLTFDLMKCLSITGSYLSGLDANEDYPHVKAGATFTTNRHFLPPLRSNEKLLLIERIEEIRTTLDPLPRHLKAIVESKLAENCNRLSTV
ncbi:MAG: hypothetical protein EOP07_21080 [Proteobacteria bacterium]|nr:MAG: hypothetical protein EOP07_21080 [Pseudomonadota bacterium]